mmetsp:Transcript_13765/g.35439  ORF Transcript_13765/g.35439 Transcript_13765/m.35439 type:complete len:428 (+) Transcript_13765:757-2040(+)
MPVADQPRANLDPAHTARIARPNCRSARQIVFVRVRHTRSAGEAEVGHRRRGQHGAIRVEGHGRRVESLDEHTGMARPRLVDVDGLRVADDIEDGRELLVGELHAQNQRRACDAPRAEVRAVPRVESPRHWLGDAAHFEHVRVRPAAGLRERRIVVLESDGGLQIVPPRIATRVDVTTRSVPVERAPVERGAGGVVAVRARAPVAVFNRVCLASLLHELGVQRLVALRAAAINLDVVEPKGVQRTDIPLVVDRQLLVLAAFAAVQVPARLEPERMNLLHHRLCVRERILDGRSAICLMLRAIDTLPARLPSLIDANLTVTHVAQADIASMASDGAILRTERLGGIDHHVLCDAVAKRIPRPPTEGRRFRKAIPSGRKILGARNFRLRVVNANGWRWRMAQCRGRKVQRRVQERHHRDRHHDEGGPLC